MIDLTSSLYLGLRHTSESLSPWAQLTTGAPAVLREPAVAGTVADALCRLIGTESATVATSTLHAFWDLFAGLEPAGISLYVDSAAYPIARWGVERASGLGATVRSFAHHDPDALRRLIQRQRHGRRPVVVVDGFCPGCGDAAPLAGYLEVTRERAGLLVLDDTQALGILGRPSAGHPYGTGGGGALRTTGAHGLDAIVVASLAKGFGAPIAVVAGSGRFVQTFERRSETRMHCSPPSVVHLLAAAHALEINHMQGDGIRRRLANVVLAFRSGLSRLELKGAPGLFPFQTLESTGDVAPDVLHARLMARGVRTVLHQSGCRRTPAVSALITARHTAADMDRVLRELSLASSGVLAGARRTAAPEAYA